MSVNVKYTLERALGLCGLKELKEKQKEPILAFINGNNVFVSFPTTYGKSIIIILVVVTRFTPKYSEAMLSKTFTAFLIEVPCNFFLFTLNVSSDFTKPTTCCHHLLHCLHFAWTRALTRSYSTYLPLENYRKFLNETHDSNSLDLHSSEGGGGGGGGGYVRLNTYHD